MGCVLRIPASQKQHKAKAPVPRKFPSRTQPSLSISRHQCSPRLPVVAQYSSLIACTRLAKAFHQLKPKKETHWVACDWPEKPAMDWLRPSVALPPARHEIPEDRASRGNFQNRKTSMISSVLGWPPTGVSGTPQEINHKCSPLKSKDASNKTRPELPEMADIPLRVFSLPRLPLLRTDALYESQPESCLLS